MSLKDKVIKLEKQIYRVPDKIKSEYQESMIIEASTSEDIEIKKNEILKARAEKLNITDHAIKFTGQVIIDDI